MCSPKGKLAEQCPSGTQSQTRLAIDLASRPATTTTTTMSTLAAEISRRRCFRPWCKHARFLSTILFVFGVAADGCLREQEQHSANIGSRCRRRRILRDRTTDTRTINYLCVCVFGEHGDMLRVCLAAQWVGWVPTAGIPDTPGLLTGFVERQRPCGAQSLDHHTRAAAAAAVRAEIKAGLD